MKSFYIPFLIVIIIVAACRQQSVPSSSPTYNRELVDAKGNLLLVGQCTRERLQQAPFDTWFTPNYNGYAVDTAFANQVKPLLQKKQLLLFMGTWCGDSRREVPRIYKLLDHCGIRPSQLQLVNVDYRDSVYKQSPTHEERGRDLRRVPTLIILEQQQETGRIVESPLQSWEKDLLAILKGEKYIPRYQQ